MEPGTCKVQGFEVDEAETALGLEPAAGLGSQHAVVVPIPCEGFGAAGGLAASRQCHCQEGEGPNTRRNGETTAVPDPVSNHVFPLR
jgi:hypothetical protein